MTTSGVTAFELTLNQIVTDAYSLAQILAEGETLTASQLSQGRNSLNMMVKTWETDSPLWGLTEGTIVCVAGQESYTLGPDGDFDIRPLKINSVRRRQFTGSLAIDTPMLAMTRDQYFDMPQKQSQGVPTQYYYDPYDSNNPAARLNTGRIYVWPTMAAGQEISLKFTYQRKLEDFVLANNTPDFPSEWTECLVCNLAVRVAQRYGQGVEPNIIAMAERLKTQLLGWDRQQSIYVNPVGFGGAGWGW